MKTRTQRAALGRSAANAAAAINESEVDNTTGDQAGPVDTPVMTNLVGIFRLLEGALRSR